jgi:hypothetical protein
MISFENIVPLTVPVLFRMTIKSNKYMTCEKNQQDLRSAAIYSVFLIIILDIYTTVSAFS